MIPAQAVEAAATVYFNRGDGYWPDMTPEAQAEALDDIRAALEAAAPYMLAGAWDGAVSEAGGCGWIHDAAANDLRARNPYRSAK